MHIRSLLLFLLASLAAFALAGQSESTPDKERLIGSNGSESEGETNNGEQPQGEGQTQSQTQQGAKQKTTKGSFMTAPKLLALSLMTLLSL